MAFNMGFPNNYGGYGNYGGCGGGFAPSRYNQGQYQQNSTDIRTGGGNNFWRRRGHFFGGRGTTGYGLNINQRPGHQRGQDGVLVFDRNRDGKYDKKDVQGSNDLMKAATGNYDFNNNGKVDFLEKLRGRSLRKQFAKMDRNHDGKLDTRELSRAGGKVWVDSDRRGDVDRNELHSVYNVPGQDRWSRQGSQRLDFVDPFSQTSHTSPNRPWYGGGYPGGGCQSGFSGGWGGGYPGIPSFGGGGGFPHFGGGWGGGARLF